MDKCKVCDKETNVIFNINFKAVHICDSCACAITKQTVIELCNTLSNREAIDCAIKG